MTTGWYQTYLRHLHSDYWHRLKQQRLEQAGHCCERCGKHQRELCDTLELHHTTLYRDCLFREKISDVQIICSVCHSAEHQRSRTKLEYIDAAGLVPDWEA